MQISVYSIDKGNQINAMQKNIDENHLLIQELENKLESKLKDVFNLKTIANDYELLITKLKDELDLNKNIILETNITMEIKDSEIINLKLLLSKLQSNIESLQEN